MFAFYAVGFILLCLNFIALYLYALSKKTQLKLDKIEYFDSQSEAFMWLISTAVGLTALIFSLSLPVNLLGFAGYIFFALFPLLTGLGFYRNHCRKKAFI